MLASDVEKEIERLKLRKEEISSKLTDVKEFEEKEKLEKEIRSIQKQIEILMRMI